jgi:site-specific DNA-methyltransferase (adenine-specific)
MNTLYYGDNLDVLRRYVADESVDLVYLDPPFNSDQNYNVLFAEQDRQVETCGPTRKRRRRRPRQSIGKS